MRDVEKLEQLIAELIIELDIDMSQGDLRHTPERVAKMLLELTRGYKESRPELWTAPWKGGLMMIEVESMPFYSLCEHHWLVFSGTVNVRYVPDELILGISKPARFVEWLSHRFMIQERFTVELCTELNSAIRPHGIEVIVDAVHTCSAMRGVKCREQSVRTTYKILKNLEAWRLAGGD